MSYAVSRRSREIAIRMSLGAERTGIARLMLLQSLALAAIGAVIGSALAVIASLGLQVVNEAPLGIDWIAFAGSGLVLLAAMLLASAIPAIRASRVNPIDNLRQS
jgi:ABC-type antimicrobial peptide transport system permease subunit